MVSFGVEQLKSGANHLTPDGDTFQGFHTSQIKIRSYMAPYPVLWTAQWASHFTPWQICSFQRHFDLSVKHSATLQLLREDYSFRYPPLSVSMYSFIQLSELRQRGMNEIASFETATRGFEPRFSRLRVRRSNRCATATTNYNSYGSS